MYLLHQGLHHSSAQDIPNKGIDLFQNEEEPRQEANVHLQMPNYRPKAPGYLDRVLYLGPHRT